jgi:putative colanic acid biosynthesis acetyltransferase WcaF
MRRQKLTEYRNPAGFRGAGLIKVQMWYVVRSILFMPSPRFANKWRVWLLRAFGAKIGRDVLIRPSAKVEYPWKLTIGDYAWVGEDVLIYSLGEISIGKNCVISQKGHLCNGSHDYNLETFDIYARNIEISDECWLAADVYVGPGVTIAPFSVVGARSSVFKSIEVSGLYVGSPAKLVEIFN